jgi:hypothetical protein
VIEQDDANVKALFRRGQANVGRASYRQARDDFDRLKSIAAAAGKDDVLASIESELKKLSLRESKAADNEKALYTKMLA